MSEGSRYVATGRITNKAGDVLAMPGETCERLAAALPGSMAGLIKRGAIKLAPEAAPRVVKPRRRQPATEEDG